MSQQQHAGPWLVTRTTLRRVPGDSRSLETKTQHACATLGYVDLRRALGVEDIDSEALADLRLRRAATLIDGSTITVEPTTALALFQAARRGPEHREGVTVVEQAVAAFNARPSQHDTQEVGGG